MKSISVSIKGKVQAVFFRKYTKDKADELLLTGFVKNLHDGSVYVEATGNDEALNKFVTWCHHGPLLAKVDSVETSQIPLKDFDGFKVTW